MARTTGSPSWVINVYGVDYQFWFDRFSRSWAIIVLNDAGEQIGDAIYAPSRELALVYIGLAAARPNSVEV